VPRRNKTSVKTIKVAERRAQAFEMRKAGANLKTIAAALGVSIPAVHKYLTTAIAQLHQKAEIDIEQYRKTELERLDDMTLGIWDKARTGGLQAIDRVLKIQRRRAKLLGLDAPSRTDLTSDGKPLLPAGAIVVTDEQLKKLPTTILEHLRSTLAAEESANDD